MMAGDWIKMRRSLLTDPRVVRISSALNADRFRTIGGLFSAWCLFDEQTSDGTLSGYTPEVFDEIVGVKGLSRAMELVGWLEINGDCLKAIAFSEHNGQSAKRRAQESVRKMSARNADTTADKKRPREEKRREEKRGDAKASPGDGVANEVFVFWNNSAAPAKVKKLTPDREVKLKARLKDPDWPWQDAIAKLPIANTATFTWQPDFDWLIANDRNAYSLAEGKFDRKAVAAFGPGQNYDPNHDYESEAF
jgi:hypothetical protein